MRAGSGVVLLVIGAAFIVIAGIGVARLPDTFQRMHAATKAGGIGTSLLVLGVLVAGNEINAMTALGTILFMLLTLSVASQLLARAAYMSGVPLEGLASRNALAGVLDRAGGPHEDGNGQVPEGDEAAAARADSSVATEGDRLTGAAHDSGRGRTV